MSAEAVLEMEEQLGMKRLVDPIERIDEIKRRVLAIVEMQPRIQTHEIEESETLLRFERDEVRAAIDALANEGKIIWRESGELMSGGHDGWYRYDVDDEEFDDF